MPDQSKGKSAIFRQAALDRLSSPEQLDQLMQVTTPHGWISLMVLGGILLTALVWGIFGSIPTKIQGTGILIKTGGIAVILPGSSGEVTDLYVDVGDMVHEGQAIARIDQPTLQEQIANAQANLDEQETQHARQMAFILQDTALQLDRLARERAAVENQISIAQDRLVWLQERVESQEQLLEKGLITRQTLLSTQDQYNSTLNEINQSQSQLKQIAVQELEARNRREQEIMSGRFRINEAKRKLQSLQEDLARSATVTSNYSGRVVEVMANTGDLVQPNTPILNLEVAAKDASEELAAVIYVPLTEGKKIRTGMIAQISPTTVKREEYGFMMGEVEYVAAFPATYQGMMRVLANDQLVRTLSSGGAPIALYARLQKDSDAPSGYAWSSREGPPTTITSGTLCGVSLVIEEQRPISMVIPYVKKQLGMGSPELQVQ